MSLESAGPAMAESIGPVAQPERLPVLDILRGFAILGMFIVHVNDYATGGGAIGAAIQRTIVWFVEGKAYATFAILFGVGCAIQLHRGGARGDDTHWRFLRRLLGVWGLIMVLMILTGGRGGTVLNYFYAGVWLLVVRRWSTRALLIGLFVSATLGGVWNVAVGSYQWATIGVERANEVYRSPRPVSLAKRAAQQEIVAARLGTSYPRFVAANLSTNQALHPDLFGDWPRGNPGVLLRSLNDAALMYFLLGLLAFRRGVFARPADHRRILIAAIFLGASLWFVDNWQLYKIPVPIPVVRVARPIHEWFVFNSAGWFLALTYIGGITLLVGSSKVWERRLAATFGAVGRLAFTNYIVQFAVLVAVMENWGLGLRGKITPQVVPVAVVILFGTLVLFSRWWLARFRFGPAEWLLRSVTYAQVQPLRRTVQRVGENGSTTQM